MERQIARAVRILKKGGVVAFPTDTLYGLGANAFDEDAVLKIYEIKSRPRNLALTLLLADIAQIKVVGDDIPKLAWELAERYMPGALTIVVKKSKAVPYAISGGRDTVAVRVPNHPIPIALISGLGAPITGTSANLSGAPDPATAEEVHKQLGSRVDMIIDGGRCPIGVSSTILDLTTDPPTILREGAIKRDELTRVCKCRIALKEG
jgi:L-threonylcarbamoyladenylate synthase